MNNLINVGIIAGVVALALGFFLGTELTAKPDTCTDTIKQVYAAFVVNGENTQAEMAQLYEACDFAEIDEALSR